MSEIVIQGERSVGAIRDLSPEGQACDYAMVLATPWPAVKLGIRIKDEAITSVDFLPEDSEDIAANSDLAEQVSWQLQNYFQDPRRKFNLPLAPQGTPFQRRVWNALRRIPTGVTTSYGALAKRLGSGARAVGGACRANPIPLIIPCHRVVAARGMGGFMGVTSGRGLDIKQYLLTHESPS